MTKTKADLSANSGRNELNEKKGFSQRLTEKKPITGFSRRLTEKKPKSKRTKEKNERFE